MHKEVIYIDVEDDITAIIGKVKATKEKVVALVPPKRVGMLQSAVNLRLLERTAKQADKHLVLITNNSALMSLAASTNLPVAKNLQSKPEVPELAALEVDDDDDIIDGSSLPIGEHAKQSSNEASAEAVAVAPSLATIDLSEPLSSATSPVKKPKVKSGVKVPNFNSFRKKLILGITGLALLIVFFVWAIVFAPHATVIVSAKTTDSSVNEAVKAGTDLMTDSAKGTLKAVKVTEAEEKSVDFTPTGKKNIGNTATGTVNFTNNSLSQQTVSSGTKLTSESGLVFVTSESVTIPAASFPCGNITCPSAGQASGGVEAAEAGAKYNSETGSLSGAPSDVNASFDGPTAGGTDNIVKVVTAADVQAAKEQLVKNTTDSMKGQLKNKFDSDVNVLDDSFRTDYSGVKSSPAVGADASAGSASLTSTVTYSLFAINKKELNNYLNAYLKNHLKDSPDQRVYENGADAASFQDVKGTKTGADLTLIATAKLGPKLDEKTIKAQSKGRQFGDIQSALQDIQGIENVDVKFFPFWLNTVPDDVKKITVEFKVNDAN